MKQIVYILAIFVTTTCQTRNTWECEGDCFNGKGIKLWMDGSIERGTWKNGELIGHGYQFFGTNSEFSGDSYEGEFLNGYSGYGIYIDVSEDATYSSYWEKGKLDGKGKLTYGRDSKYPNSYYDGEFRNGMWHGYGVRFWGEAGEFKNHKYQGDWKNDKRDGFGRYDWPNIGTYIGSWKEGEENGKGIYIFTNGDTLKSQWVKGYCRELAIMLHEEDALSFTSLIYDINYESFETTKRFIDETLNQLSLYENNSTYKVNFRLLRELLDTALIHKKKLLPEIKSIQEFDEEITYKQDFLNAQYAVIDVLNACDTLINFNLSNEDKDILQQFRDSVFEKLKVVNEKKYTYEKTKKKFIKKYE